MLLLRYSGFKRPSKSTGLFITYQHRLGGISLGRNILKTNLDGKFLQVLQGIVTP